MSRLMKAAYTLKVNLLNDTLPFWVEKPKPAASRPPKESVRGWSPAPKAQYLLLPVGSKIKGQNGEEYPALGTGVVVLLGSARSSKSSTALALIEWALIASKKRNAAFVGMPPDFLEALPPHMKARSTAPSFDDITKLRDSIVLIDDAAVHLNARMSMGGGLNRLISRLAGVISHLGITLIICVQSMSGLDLSLLRFCEMSPLIKRVDPMALEHERNEWTPSVKAAQRSLAGVGFNRSYYVSLADNGLLCEAPYPLWMRPTKGNRKKADALSRPFRFMTQAGLDEMVGLKPKPKEATK